MLANLKFAPVVRSKIIISTLYAYKQRTGGLAEQDSVSVP